MSRTSRDLYVNGRLIMGFDYSNQAWVIDGRYQACGHPAMMDCHCYGTLKAGTRTPKENLGIDPGEYKATLEEERNKAGRITTEHEPGQRELDSERDWL